jgi:signal peptidase II
VTIARRWRWFAVVLVLTAVADQVSKWWVLQSLPKDSRGFGLPVTVIDGLWDWRLSYNTGSAFGMFHGTGGARVFLSLVGVAALGAMAWMVHKAKDDQRRLLLGLGLVAGGAIGNLVDRVLVGKVTDFVVWKFHGHEWPTFNVADVALCIGVGLLMLDLGKKPADAAAPADGPRKGGKRRR